MDRRAKVILIAFHLGVPQRCPRRRFILREHRNGYSSGDEEREGESGKEGRRTARSAADGVSRILHRGGLRPKPCEGAADARSSEGTKIRAAPTGGTCT